MNEEAQKMMAEEVLRWLRGAGDLFTEQAPLVAQEIARFGIIKHALLCLMFCGMLGICAWLGRHVWKHAEDGVDQALAIFPGLVGMCFSLGAVWNLIWMFQALLMPRLYVLETVAGMIK